VKKYQERVIIQETAVHVVEDASTTQAQVGKSSLQSGNSRRGRTIQPVFQLITLKSLDSQAQRDLVKEEERKPLKCVVKFMQEVVRAKVLL